MGGNVGRIVDGSPLPGVPLRAISMTAPCAPRRAPKPWRQAASSCASYLAHGLQLLGEHFAAGALAARLDAEASAAAPR
jgi:hypothetical protein